MKIVSIIPARMESSRLPNKALVDIEGLPMIVHTFKRTELSNALDDVYVATDSDEIKEAVESNGGKVIMTGSHHQTGSDRIAEAAQNIDADIIVNVQGDEPLLDPEHIDAAVKPMKEDESINIVILVTPYTNRENPQDIKAVLDLNDYILYCSRTDLPSETRIKVDRIWKMSFIVPFRKEFLLQYAAWEQTPLEKIEYNEYLRILENGYKIKAVKVDGVQISVDVPDDLEIVRNKMKTDIIKHKYMAGV